jgi:aspartate 1-decarboxylase
LRVTAFAPAGSNTVVLSPQICWAAKLCEDEPVVVHNESNGRTFLARARQGEDRRVEVHGPAGLSVEAGHTLTIVAQHAAAPKETPPAGCTFCLCEKNQVIEIRFGVVSPVPSAASAPPIEVVFPSRKSPGSE